MSVKVAASQFKSIKEKKDLNINKAIHIAQQASKENVNIFLLQELFQTEYFCSTQDNKFFNYAIEFPNEQEYCIDTYDDSGDVQGSLKNDYFANSKYDNKKLKKKTKFHIGKFAVIR